MTTTLVPHARDKQFTKFGQTLEYKVFDQDISKVFARENRKYI